MSAGFDELHSEQPNFSAGRHGMSIETVDDVKKALAIREWRDLSAEQFFQLAAMMPQIDKDVQPKILDQLPEIAKIAIKQSTEIRKVHESTLASNDRSQDQVHSAYREVRAAYAAQLQEDDLDPEVRMYLNGLIMQTADKQSAKDSENKPFLERTFVKATLSIAAGIAAVAVIAGRALLQGDERNWTEIR